MHGGKSIRNIKKGKVMFSFWDNELNDLTALLKQKPARSASPSRSNNTSKPGLANEAKASRRHY